MRPRIIMILAETRVEIISFEGRRTYYIYLCIFLATINTQSSAGIKAFESRACVSLFLAVSSLAQVTRRSSFERELQ